MRPRVWAPRADRVELVLADGGRVELEPRDGGWFEGGPELGHGDRYGYALDGGPPLPDPRSRWQPDGVHGLSAVDDPETHHWTDDEWTGLERLGGTIYELHVGTFTPEGTLDAAIDRLDHLVDLGVSAVELLPVAEAMGERGWGYDGVDLWAVHHAYGGPAALRRFVDAAHRAGIGVLLDVVYNHLGPEGAYLDRFGPYFIDDHSTPWGPGVNLDGPGSTEVRRFIVDNGVHWCAEHHIDGLRIDATHHLRDRGPTHVVAELVAALDVVGRGDGRRRWTIVEREQAELLPLRAPEHGGWGVDARWGDDLHHALHAHLTGERDGYYAPFGALADVATVLRRGHLPPGEALTPDVAPERLVTCSQNHDQIGNRPGGERLHHLAGIRPAMAAAAVVILGPGTPLLFQGEEWAATSRFPFFCDTQDADLADRIRAGRHAELEPLGWSPDDIDDPLDPSVFAAARLDWDEPARPPHREVHDWYRALVHLRRSESGLGATEVSVEVDEGARTLVMRRGRLALLVNLAEVEAALPVQGDLVVANGPVDERAGATVLSPGCTAVLRLPSTATRCGGRRSLD
ncbi:MAG TPA: malto-oligosyltrehalose trehalohydrolase [Acidimicrobiales bacterium]|nr:malto-oligosyltrehalose trehalohydrolase [Acidimicrobiales bacterium]